MTAPRLLRNATPAVLALLLSARLHAADPLKDQSLFCTIQPVGNRVQAYPPLIDSKLSTDFMQFTFTGKDRHLYRMIAKHFTDRYELMYVYQFGEGGKLTSLHGQLRRWGRWTAEADLFPDPDGSVPVPEVKYRLSEQGGIIAAPEGADAYTNAFRKVPVYRMTTELPCASAVLDAKRSLLATP